MKQTEKAKVRKVFEGHSNVSFLDNRDNLRNGLIKVDIEHNSQTLPNERIGKMSQMGYVVSCVCGSLDENHHTAVYFEKIEGISF